MNETKKRTLIPRKLKLVPAALLSIIILAVLSLLGLLNFNPPSLNDSTAEQSESEAEVEEETESVAENSFVSADALLKPTKTIDQEPAPLEPLDLVDVLIDGDDYLFAVGQYEGEFVRETKSVAEIVAAAQESHGDASGVKIRISRTFSATAQAERTLVRALSEAGLSEDEIDQRRTLVE